MRNGSIKISKAQFYKYGAFSNPNLYRIQRGRGWAYYQVYDNN